MDWLWTELLGRGGETLLLGSFCGLSNVSLLPLLSHSPFPSLLAFCILISGPDDSGLQPHGDLIPLPLDFRSWLSPPIPLEFLGGPHGPSCTLPRVKVLAEQHTPPRRPPSPQPQPELSRSELTSQ